MTDFAGKVVLVTGGASGIGASVAQYFTNAGAVVCICDIVKVDSANSYDVDVKDAAALEGAMVDIINKYGDIDIIVNNVGVSEFEPITEISIDSFDRVIATNLRPAFITSRFFARHRNTEYGRARYGRIINISSTRYQQSEPHSEAYAASKGAVVALTHALAISLSEYNTTVNSISPGWIDTGKFSMSDEDHRQHPSGRVGSVDDVARMCLFISAPANDFLNGENITLDGGVSKKMIYIE